MSVFGVQAKFAKQSGIETIPVVMQGGGWTPSGWLGLLMAGMLWTPLHEEASFESNVHLLHRQIENVLRQSGLDEFDKAELKRLVREQLSTPYEQQYPEKVLAKV